MPFVVLFLNFARRASVASIQEALSLGFKSKQHAPSVYLEHDLFIQEAKLKNTLRWLMRQG